MDDKAQSKEQTDNKEAEIEIEVKPDLEEQKKIKELNDIKDKRQRECTAEFKKLLEKYNCYTYMETTLNSNGGIRHKLVLLAK
jgi:hypothetical protein